MSREEITGPKLFTIQSLPGLRIFLALQVYHDYRAKAFWTKDMITYFIRRTRRPHVAYKINLSSSKSKQLKLDRRKGWLPGWVETLEKAQAMPGAFARTWEAPKKLLAYPSHRVGRVSLFWKSTLCWRRRGYKRWIKLREGLFLLTPSLMPQKR